jgi:hypothetical protein
MPIDPSRVLLGLDASPRARLAVAPALSRGLKALGLYVEGTGRGESLAAVHHTSRHLWVRDRRQRAIGADRLARLTDALGPGVRWTAAVERHGRELFAPLQDALVVAPRPTADLGLVARRLSALGLREWIEKSRYLGRWRYFIVENPVVAGATALAGAVMQVHGALVERVHVEYLSHAPSCTIDPNDLFYFRQWAPAAIGAPAAWDVASGAGVTVAVIDSGCELAHPDLRLTGPGLNLEDMTSDASPLGIETLERAHGTLVAGIIGARLNNFTGVAGVAGNCQVLPLAADTYTHATVAAGIRYAMAEGARVVNMSFRVAPLGFEASPLREAIEDAAAAGLVLCASSGNGNDSSLILPAKHPAVMACGGSTEADRRWVSSATQGSGYGDEVYLGAPVGVSVVAPGINVFTTDLLGPEGENPGESRFDGDYAYFHATSAAAPHVSGLAAMLMSRDPSLTGAAVRRIIERTAEKVGGYAYRDIARYHSGTRHPEMGYGRIHAFRAVDLGDVMIADWPGDDGLEPSTPPGGVFWTRSDLVVRPADDGVFDPGDPAASTVLTRGLDHTVSARVRNVGPAEARHVHVEVRVTPWVGLEFVYPDDWTRDDAMHLRPAPVEADFATIEPDGSRIARFTLTAAQADVAAGWSDRVWHPCLLGVVTSANDYAFDASAGGRALQMPRNNLAQRNLTVASPERRSLYWPFVIGHPKDGERTIELLIDAGRVARDGRVDLILDDDGRAFPLLQRMKAWSGRRPALAKIAGGRVTTAGGRRAVTMTGPRMAVRLALPRPGRYPLALAVRRPTDARAGERFPVSVAQRSLRRGIVGGASLVV